MGNRPRVSVVIPSFSRDRSRSLARLRQAMAEQTLDDHELIVVEGVSPQGRAINQGAARARGEYLVVIDDDSEIRDPELLAKLVATLEQDASIGMAGASVRTPDDATWFQRRAARELPRFNVPVVTEVTDSDQACHGCTAFRLAVFRVVGGEREQLVRGLDPDLRQRLRERGLRVVLVPQAVVYHPLPASPRRFLDNFLRNGAGSARAQRLHPDLVFETDERLDSIGFVPRRRFAFRLLRFPFRIAWALLTLRPIRAAAYLSYAFGFLGEYWRLRRPQRQP